MNYFKIAKSIPDLIVMLKHRGLAVEDDVKAAEFLKSVSYFRLAAYLKEHYLKYGKESFPPAWKALELASSIFQTIKRRKRLLRVSLCLNTWCRRVGCDRWVDFEIGARTIIAYGTAI